MERLTQRSGSDENVRCKTEMECTGHCENCDHFRRMQYKLWYYENLDERGNVIRDGDAHRLFANITISKEDLQEMVDKKFEEISINIDGLIDEFVKQCRESMDRITACVPIEDVEDIAENLKKELKYNEKINED